MDSAVSPPGPKKNLMARMWRRSISIALMCFASACATTAKYEAMLSTWVGSDADKLVTKWGYPDKTFQAPNGNTVYVYDTGRSLKTPVTAQTDAWTGVTTVTGGQTIKWWCRTFFEANAAGKIVRWRWEGNACRTREDVTPRSQVASYPSDRYSREAAVQSLARLRTEEHKTSTEKRVVQRSGQQAASPGPVPRSCKDGNAEQCLEIARTTTPTAARGLYSAACFAPTSEPLELVIRGCEESARLSKSFGEEAEAERCRIQACKRSPPACWEKGGLPRTALPRAATPPQRVTEPTPVAPVPPSPPRTPEQPLPHLRDASSPSPTPSTTETPRGWSLHELEGALVVADDGHALGRITSNCLDAKAICNKLGKYGSELDPDSLKNNLGIYGGKLSGLSPFNNFTQTPPKIFHEGRFLAFLTTNTALNPRVDPLWLLAALEMGP